MPVFKWDKKKNEAALLYAQREIGTEAICNRLGIGRTTLHSWLQVDEFKERVEKLRKEIAEEVRRHGIAVVEYRVSILQDMAERMQQVIRERAAAAEHRDIPGGRTGTIVIKDRRSIPVGKDAEGNMEYEQYIIAEVDTGLLSELRQHMKQAAQELGQWSETQKLEVGRGVPRLGRMKKRKKEAEGAEG